MLELSSKTNLLEESSYRYSLQDVDTPNLYRDMYNYEEKIKDKEIFFKSFCIKKMFKYSENKTILKNDTNFVWPKLNKWIYDKMPVYSIFIRKCLPYDKYTNTTFICKTSDEMDTYFENNLIKMSLYYMEYFYIRIYF